MVEPINSVIQMRVSREKLKKRYRNTLDFQEPSLVDRVWVDTVWSSLVDAQQHHPGAEYREVMTQW